MKTATNPATVIDDVRARILRIDREAFVTDVRTMDDLIGDSLASRWFATLLLAVCATIGLLLALSGIYSIVTQAVIQRQFEIGLRLALGATPRGVVRLMRRRSVIPVASGAAVGLLVMMATARLLSAMLFETRPLDPITFIGATGLFVLVALVAALVPARRATRSIRWSPFDASEARPDHSMTSPSVEVAFGSLSKSPRDAANCRKIESRTHLTNTTARSATNMPMKFPAS